MIKKLVSFCHHTFEIETQRLFSCIPPFCTEILNRPHHRPLFNLLGDIQDKLENTRPIQDKLQKMAIATANLHTHWEHPPCFDALPPIVIAGAGIGGLILATALLRLGVPPSQITLYECRTRNTFMDRFNNIQLRNDYRKQNPFLIIPELTTLLGENLVSEIQRTSTHLLKDIIPDHDQDRLMISIGYLQSLIFQRLPETCFQFQTPVTDQDLQELSQSGSLIFDCRGTKPTSLYNIAQANDTYTTYHQWSIPKISFTQDQIGTTYTEDQETTKKVLAWNYPLRTEQDSYLKFFAEHFLKQCLKDKENLPIQTKSVYEGLLLDIQSGQRQTLSYTLVHTEHLELVTPETPWKLTCQLRTTPHIATPKYPGIFPLCDKLCPPHPRAANGMIGVIKSIKAAVGYIENLLHLENPLQKKKAETLFVDHLYITGLFQASSTLALCHKNQRLRKV